VKIKIKIIPGNKINSKQLNNFYQLWSRNKPFGWLFKPSFYELKSLVESFGQKCFFVFVSHCHSALDAESIQMNFRDSCFRRNDKTNLAAACLILTSPNMAFYWHNCSNKEGKKLFAPTLCLWTAIKESKKRGLKIFDFEGVWDERYPKLNRGWQGFTRFKLGFIGK
jgi:hypothetical protein